MTGHTTNAVGRSGVARLFASQTLVAVLARFATQPERTFYQRELSRLTGSSLYLVQRELARLESVGLVVRSPRGRQVEYSIVLAHPAWPPLRDLLLRTAAPAAILSETLAPLGSRILLAWVFGSVARGDDRVDSDLDLMIVGAVGLKDLATLDLPGPDILGRTLNIVTYTPDELRRRAASDNHFVTEVLGSPRIWIEGGEDELVSLVGGGTAPAASRDP